MMNKTFYELLGVDKSASPELLAEAYRLSLNKIEALLNSGDMRHQNELVLIKEAYRTLSNPEKRAIYDASLPSLTAPATSPLIYEAAPYAAESGMFMRWWESSKTSMVLAGLLLLFVGYLGLGYLRVAGSNTAASDVTSVDALRASNQGRLVDGVISNEELQANAANRMADAVDKAVEHRAEAEAQLIDMQRRELEARLELQRERQEQFAAQQEALRLERERRYYACLNGAIDRVGTAEAAGYCARFR